MEFDVVTRVSAEAFLWNFYGKLLHSLMQWNEQVNPGWVILEIT